MDNKIRTVGAGVLLAVWLGLSAFAWFGTPEAMSEPERRPLQQMPKISANALLSGSFMEKFEDYSLDQFPLRDTFRSAKALFSYGVLRQKDNNGIYLKDGYAAKLEYPLNSPSLNHALRKFNTIYERYLQNTGSPIYMTVIPDKGYYLAQAGDIPSMDYGQLFSAVADGMPWAKTVDITKDLELAHYYRTDTHWRQEALLPAAQTLCRAMGVELPRSEDFTPVLATGEFYGVYYGQAALPMKAEKLWIMENDLIKNCTVYNHETGQTQGIYDMQKITGLDPYEVFLSGAQALLTIDNPAASGNRELIVFRDSFASSLVPLLVQGYRTVTLVDIRYVSSQMLGEYLDFHGQDVLFAYSTLILNNSGSLK